MKKFLTLAALIALAGCSNHYEYYKGGVLYTQDGDNCIYQSGEQGRHYSSNVNSADLNKKIVYRNTRCSDLYARDTLGQEPRQERRVLAPATEVTYIEDQSAVVAEPRQIVVQPTAKKSCGCAAKKAKRQYVVVSGM